MVETTIYQLIEAMRKAQEDYCAKEGLEQAYWCVDLVVHEMDSGFEKSLKKVIDWDSGYEFTEGRPR